MSNESFYGGKPGKNFIIKEVFSSIDEMKNNFSQGDKYTDVWFYEYCMIDTPNKNHVDNGKIFYRGLDYQNNETNGAVYVGQIVGPSSGTPYFQLGNIDFAKAQASIAANGEDVHKEYPIQFLDKSNKYQISKNGDGNDLGIFELDEENFALVPGKKGNDYNDSIKYTWVNIREDSADSDSYVYLGFEIPYLCQDISVKQVSPYKDGKYYDGNIDVVRKDDLTHPFYQWWEYYIPKGVKGDCWKNLRIIKGSQFNSIPTLCHLSQLETAINDFNNNENFGNSYINSNSILLQEKENDSMILVADYWNYEEYEEWPHPITVRLAPYNVIDNVVLDEDGTLIINYTYDDDTVFNKKIKWINDASLTNGNGVNGGHFNITFNTEESYDADLTWVKDIDFMSDGSIELTFCGTDGGNIPDDGKKEIQNLIQWITNLNLNPDTGVFNVTYNNNADPYTTTLDWIKSIQLDNDGSLHFIHTKENKDEVISNAIKWITSATLNKETGQFVITFNYGEPINEYLDWVDSVDYDEETGVIRVHNVNSGYSALSSKLTAVTGAEMDENGVLTFTTNTGTAYNTKIPGTDQDFRMRMLKTMYANDETLQDDQKIYAKYSDQDTAFPLTKPFNYIVNTTVRPDDWHLFVLFSDPEKRAKAENLNENLKDSNGQAWISNNTVRGWDSSIPNYGSNVFWKDLGAIKDQSGLLIGFNITESDLGTFSTPLEYLNNRFPNGLNGSANQPGGNSTTGKIITYGESDGTKQFYAFDYNSGSPGTWIYLGEIANSGNRDATLFTDAISAEDLIYISNKGVLIRAVTTPYSENPIPNFWENSYVWV